jgi:hypothetical protein
MPSDSSAFIYPNGLTGTVRCSPREARWLTPRFYLNDCIRTKFSSAVGHRSVHISRGTIPNLADIDGRYEVESPRGRIPFLVTMILFAQNSLFLFGHVLWVGQPRQSNRQRNVQSKTGTFGGTFSHDPSNYRKDLARPTGIEPVLRVPETLVISFSLRARAKFFITGSSISQRAVWQSGWPRGPFRRE